MTVIYFLVYLALQNNLPPIGVRASLGGLFLPAWSAVGLSIAALLARTIVIFCCCI